jgi:hypothetical protein
MNHCPRIKVKLVDPNNQRLLECGDWIYDAEDDVIIVFVNRMEDWRSELAVMLHEIFEAVSCIAADVDQTDVDFFDKKFYLEHDDDSEAGDSRDAPYHAQHVGASFVEKEVCSQLKIDWKTHEINCL